jgi:hypothetical protein
MKPLKYEYFTTKAVLFCNDTEIKDYNYDEIKIVLNSGILPTIQFRIFPSIA